MEIIRFRGGTKNSEIRESFLPRKFHGIQYRDFWEKINGLANFGLSRCMF